MIEKRRKKDVIRWRLRSSDKELLKQAAATEARALANWLDYYVVSFAERQLAGEPIDLEPLLHPRAERKDAVYPWRIREGGKPIVEAAAKEEGRTVSNWLDVWALAIAGDQLTTRL